MHDIKVLWTYGHAYHHKWRVPEHMIGVTNYSFDHVVETWVTMSSAMFPMVVFPGNFFITKFLSLAYMCYAVLVHWDGFGGFSKYHLNHHYLVVKNYGSHVPIFDILFGTYEWGSHTWLESATSRKKE